MPTVAEALDIASQHRRAHCVAQAEQIYRDILEYQPDQPEALYGLGLLAFQSERYRHAETLLHKALELQPDSAEIHFTLGRLQQAQGHWSKAAPYYRKALATHPDSASVHNNLGLTLQLQGERDEPLVHFQKALEIQPTFLDADTNLANALHAQGKLDPAKFEHYSSANYYLGILRQKEHSLATAMVHYRQAIVLQPGFVDAYLRLGLVLQASDRWEEAISSYKKALELDPNYGKAFIHLGKAYQYQDRLPEAISVYRQGLKRSNVRYAQAVAQHRKAGTTSTLTQGDRATPPLPMAEVKIGRQRFPRISPVLEGVDERPFWSVVITVYNRVRYLPECLTSVLAQWPGIQEMEVLVVDDASTASIADLVDSVGGGVVRYYRNTHNLGMAGTWNAGVALSRGQWIHLLHDDDYVLPGFYSSLKQSLEGCSSAVGAAFTGYENVTDNDKVTFRQQLYGDDRGIAQDFLDQVGIANPLNPPAVVVRRSTYEHLGGYSPKLGCYFDWELYKRIAAHYDWWHEPGVLARYREHPHRQTDKVNLSPDFLASITDAIETSASYLPKDKRTEILTESRRHYFNYCLHCALAPLRVGDLPDTLAVIRSALRIDQSPQAIADLFRWLTKDEAAALRAEITSRLFLSSAATISHRGAHHVPTTDN